MSFFCKTCLKLIRSNQCSIFCDSCKNWIHLKCIDLRKSTFLSLGLDSDDWYCLDCMSHIFPFNHYDDEAEFRFELYIFMQGSHVSYEQLSNMKFNPFKP